MRHWTDQEIPDLQGQVALITGANSGLGFETTRVLAAHGAHVVMACRNLDKARQAQGIIKATVPQASLELAILDLASLTSVRAFARNFSEQHPRLNLLFNNAGVMAIPRQETEAGIEVQFGTNHVGHFALTGLVLSTLLATPQSRIVTMTSAARSMGRIRFDDLNRTRSYGRWAAYGQSKLANLLFAFELQRRLAAAGATTISVAAHPGYATTNLQTTSATVSGKVVERLFYASLGRILAQSARMGALPQLYAGTASGLLGGELVGPGGFAGMRGYPRIAPKAQREDDQATAARLWKVSVELSGVDYGILQSITLQRRI
jgi:NAD(P)-dependent dehydrogenase (short-subunit alcohol dehydrogenase family)